MEKVELRTADIAAENEMCIRDRLRASRRSWARLRWKRSRSSSVKAAGPCVRPPARRTFFSLSLIHIYPATAMMTPPSSSVASAAVMPLTAW